MSKTPVFWFYFRVFLHLMNWIYLLVSCIAMLLCEKLQYSTTIWFRGLWPLPSSSSGGRVLGALWAPKGIPWPPLGTHRDVSDSNWADNFWKWRHNIRDHFIFNKHPWHVCHEETYEVMCPTLQGDHWGCLDQNQPSGHSQHEFVQPWVSRIILETNWEAPT